MKQWTARASELFDKCHRKTGVQFPDEARGWLLLHRAGLSEEQKAVVIARARGDLKRESVAAALRPYYPELVISKRRTAVALAEDTPAEPDAEASTGKNNSQMSNNSWRITTKRVPTFLPMLTPSRKQRWPRSWRRLGKSADKS